VLGPGVGGAVIGHAEAVTVTVTAAAATAATATATAATATATMGGWRRGMALGLLVPAAVLAVVLAAGGGARLAAVGAVMKARQAASRTTTPLVPVRVAFSRVRAADGSVITIAAFSGPARYVLHDGSQDPGALAGRVAAGPKVTGSARARLVAAFNGGFRLASLAGGYEQAGQIARPIRTGLASLVIDAAGRARIGVWGSGVPAAGERVYSVRQNLWLLVSGGRPTRDSARWWRWGGTIGHAEYVARSALGESRPGELMYAASMSTTPADLAWALARAGTRVAMELDINPEWVQLDAASRPGGPLRAGIPGQHRPADQYLTGWTRDFIAVESP
jgi:hypothetical protein